MIKPISQQNATKLTFSSNAMPTGSKTFQRCNKSLQRCIIHLLSYAALQRFIAALSNLTRPWCI